MKNLHMSHCEKKNSSKRDHHHKHYRQEEDGKKCKKEGCEKKHHKKHHNSHPGRQKKEESNGALDDETMNFVELWSYTQSAGLVDALFSPEDIVLMEELVAGQNFQIALDILRQKLKPMVNVLPQDMADIARPAKCIKVRDTSQFEQAYTAERFTSERVPTASAALDSFIYDAEYQEQVEMARPLPPPRVIRPTFTRAAPGVGELLPASLTETDYMQEESRLRVSLLEQQDAAYEESLRADKEKAEVEYMSKQEQKEREDREWDEAEAEWGAMAVPGNTEDEFWTNLFTGLPPLLPMIDTDNEDEDNGKMVEVAENEQVIDPLDPDAVLVLVRMPGTGQVKEQRFLRYHTFAHVAKWVASVRESAEAKEEIKLATNFPRTIWEADFTLDMAPIDRGRLNLIATF